MRYAFDRFATPNSDCLPLGAPADGDDEAVASDRVVDLEQLLGPIAGEQTCGEPLTGDVFSDIKELRKADDLRPIVELTANVLSSRSKDLRLAAYLVEALLQQHGIAGLRDGLAVLCGLMEQYWDEVYPRIEVDEQGNPDLEMRASPLDLFSEKIPVRVRLTALMPGGDEVAFSWNFWNSRQVGGQREGEDPEVFARRRAEAEQRAQAFDQRAMELDRGHFVTLVDDLGQAAEQIERLRGLVNAHLSDVAPSLNRLSEAVADCRRLAEAILKTKPAPVEDADGTDEPEEEQTDGTRRRSGPVRTRAEALAQLAAIAAYFRSAEPHSPISYLIQRAARWGTMSLEQIINELVKDDTVRGQIGELLDFQTTITAEEPSE